MSADRTAWFKDCGWGLFTHYLAYTEEEMQRERWNKKVNSYDVEGIADQLASVHAPYFYITLYQNSGAYIAPSDTVKQIVGEDLYCWSHMGGSIQDRGRRG